MASVTHYNGDGVDEPIVPDLGAEEVYKLRDHTFTFEVPTVSMGTNTYYDTSSRSHPERLHRIGEVDRFPLPPDEKLWGIRRKLFKTYVFCEPKSKDKLLKKAKQEVKEKLAAKKIYEEPQTAEARENRMKNFQALADSSISLNMDDNNPKDFFDFLEDDFEVVYRLPLQEISGVPSLPKNVVMCGNMELVLAVPIKKPNIPNNGHPRLMIVATAGTKLINIKEDFKMSRIEPMGLFALCCSPSCISYICPCCAIGGYFMNYEIGQTFQAHYIDMPLFNTVFDAVAFKEFDRLITTKSGIDAAAKGCSIYCCDRKECYLCCCDYCSLCCICCNWCTCYCERKSYWDIFTAKESHTMNQLPPTHLKGTHVSERIAWETELRGYNESIVKLQYVHLDGQDTEANPLRTMRLVVKESKESFKEAKRLVSTLGTIRIVTEDFQREAMRLIAEANNQKKASYGFLGGTGGANRKGDESDKLGTLDDKEERSTLGKAVDLAITVGQLILAVPMLLAALGGGGR